MTETAHRTKARTLTPVEQSRAEIIAFRRHDKRRRELTDEDLLTARRPHIKERTTESKGPIAQRRRLLSPLERMEKARKITTLQMQGGIRLRDDWERRAGAIVPPDETAKRPEGITPSEYSVIDGQIDAGRRIEKALRLIEKTHGQHVLAITVAVACHDVTMTKLFGRRTRNHVEPVSWLGLGLDAVIKAYGM